MPKYEDFKVGDKWIRRDGKEVLIAKVEPERDVSGELNEWPIQAGYWEEFRWYRSAGVSIDGVGSHSYDLISKVVDEPEYLPAPAPKSLRDEIAIEAMKKLMLNLNDPTFDALAEKVRRLSKISYFVADAMMEARKIEGVTA